MKHQGLWSGLQGLWQPHHVVPPSPADELVVTNALQVRRTLGELARLQTPVALQAADGRFMGGGVLDIDGALGVRVHVRSLEGGPFETVPWPVNATASGSRGLVLFTLHPRAPGTPRLLFADWPEQLIHLQSRRHFRLTAPGGKRRRAWLSRPGAAANVPVHDLSEEGVGVEVAAHGWPAGGYSGQALLHLDEEVIPVPLLEVVHSRPRAAGHLGIVGARMLGMGEEQLRVLRRWIAAVQATQGAAPGAAV
jgi:hypothetical protein